MQVDLWTVTDGEPNARARRHTETNDHSVWGQVGIGTLVVVIMFSAMLSALMIRTVDGGHKMNTYVHFVALSWIAAVISIVTKVLVGAFLSV